jgi:hypothetical protein
MAKILFLLMAVVAVAKSEKKFLELVPGKSLGEVSIGEAKADLLRKGFAVDDSRWSEEYTYLLKQPVLVLLKGDKVAEICLMDVPKHLSRLRYKGKDFPRTAKLDTVSGFIGDCAEPVVGSGGIIRRCARGQVELATRFPSGEVENLCVKSPGS